MNQGCRAEETNCSFSAQSSCTFTPLQFYRQADKSPFFIILYIHDSPLCSSSGAPACRRQPASIFDYIHCPSPARVQTIAVWPHDHRGHSHSEKINILISATSVSSCSCLYLHASVSKPPLAQQYICDDTHTKLQC